MKLPDLTGWLFAPKAIKWFRWSIAGTALFHFFVLLPLWFRNIPVYDAVHPFPGSGFWHSATYLLSSSPVFVHVIFLSAFFGAALLLFNQKWRIPACLILLFTGHNLVALCYPFLNMSQYLLLVLITFLLFMDERADEKKGALGVISRGLTNTFYIICWAQVVAAYIFPFFYKVQGEIWLNGTALGTILSIPEFSRNFILGFARPDHWFLMLLTWVTLLYQAVFPILIWWKKGKPYLLVAGVMFNVGIGIAMGLLDITVVMIAAYAILLDEAAIKKLRSWVPVLSRRREADLSSSA